MTGKLDERIAGLEQRLKQLRTHQARVQARMRTVVSRRERREDTRRKILIGAIILAKIDQGAFDGALLKGWLDAALTRADDRALFDLKPNTLGTQATQY